MSKREEEKEIKDCFKMLSALQSPAAYSEKIDYKARDTNALAEQLNEVLEGSKDKQQTAFYRELNAVLNLRERAIALLRLASLLLANNIPLGKDLTKFPYNWLYTGATTAFRHYGQYLIYFTGSVNISMALEMPDDCNTFMYIEMDGCVDLYSDLKHGHMRFTEKNGELTPEGEERDKILHDVFDKPMIISGVHIWDIPGMHKMLRRFITTFPKFESAVVEYSRRVLKKKVKELKNEE